MESKLIISNFITPNSKVSKKFVKMFRMIMLYLFYTKISSNFEYLRVHITHFFPGRGYGIAIRKAKVFGAPMF